MMRRPFTLFAALVVVLSVSAPVVNAHGDEAHVTLTAVGTDAAAHTAAVCDLALDAGADGLEMLDAAVASGCVSGYDTAQFTGLGAYVTCLDGVCDGPDALDANCMSWLYTVNGELVGYGVEGYEASDGDVFSFYLAPYGSPAIGFC